MDAALHPGHNCNTIFGQGAAIFETMSAILFRLIRHRGIDCT